ncbi:MAG: hypothetical protein PHW73_02490 [Atribacterota bacterium]|nr:hypothetical protein [Atribacterota bacterium]
MKPISYLIKKVRIVKQLIANLVILKSIAIFFYKLFGRKPWSIGYSFYKRTFIKAIIEKRLDIFKSEKLPCGYGFKMDERVVEYPWFFSKLKEEGAVILDAGAALNHPEILELANLKNKKLYITTLSYEGFQIKRDTVYYRYGDLRTTSYENDFFDAIACISTLEHIGMNNELLYISSKHNDKNDKSGFLDAMKEFKRILRVGGTLYVTIPFGQYKDLGWMQVFNSDTVGKLIEQFSPSHKSETYFKYENNQWNFSNRESCQNAAYFDFHHESGYKKDYLAAAQSVVCLKLVK